METAPCQVEFTREDDLLRARVTGTNDSLDIAVAYWMDVAREVRRVQPATLLVVDDTVGTTPSPEELLQLVQGLQGLGLEGVRVAFVECSVAQISEVEHAEIFARELGFDARVFASETEARIWLRHGET